MLSRLDDLEHRLAQLESVEPCRCAHCAAQADARASRARIARAAELATRPLAERVTALRTMTGIQRGAYLSGATAEDAIEVLCSLDDREREAWLQGAPRYTRLVACELVEAPEMVRVSSTVSWSRAVARKIPASENSIAREVFGRAGESTRLHAQEGWWGVPDSDVLLYRPHSWSGAKQAPRMFSMEFQNYLRKIDPEYVTAIDKGHLSVHVLSPDENRDHAREVFAAPEPLPWRLPWEPAASPNDQRAVLARRKMVAS